MLPVKVNPVNQPVPKHLGAVTPSNVNKAHAAQLRSFTDDGLKKMSLDDLANELSRGEPAAWHGLSTQQKNNVLRVANDVLRNVRARNLPEPEAARRIEGLASDAFVTDAIEAMENRRCEDPQKQGSRMWDLFRDLGSHCNFPDFDFLVRLSEFDRLNNHVSASSGTFVAARLSWRKNLGEDLKSQIEKGSLAGVELIFRERRNALTQTGNQELTVDELQQAWKFAAKLDRTLREQCKQVERIEEHILGESQRAEKLAELAGKILKARGIEPAPLLEPVAREDTDNTKQFEGLVTSCAKCGDANGLKELVYNRLSQLTKSERLQVEWLVDQKLGRLQTEDPKTREMYILLALLMNPRTPKPAVIRELVDSLAKNPVQQVTFVQDKCLRILAEGEEKWDGQGAVLRDSLRAKRNPQAKPERDPLDAAMDIVNYSNVALVSFVEELIKLHDAGNIGGMLLELEKKATGLLDVVLLKPCWRYAEPLRGFWNTAKRLQSSDKEGDNNLGRRLQRALWPVTPIEGSAPAEFGSRIIQAIRSEQFEQLNLTLALFPPGNFPAVDMDTGQQLAAALREAMPALKNLGFANLHGYFETWLLKLPGQPQ